MLGLKESLVIRVRVRTSCEYLFSAPPMDLIKSTKQWHMVGWERDLKNLKTVKLYGDRFLVLNKKLALDRCPHRGASLSLGKVVDGCVKCPFPNRYFSEVSNPTMFSGIVK